MWMWASTSPRVAVYDVVPLRGRPDALMATSGNSAQPEVATSVKTSAAPRRRAPPDADSPRFPAAGSLRRKVPAPACSTLQLASRLTAEADSTPFWAVPAR